MCRKAKSKPRPAFAAGLGFSSLPYALQLMTHLDTLENFLASQILSAAAYSQYCTGDVSKYFLKDYAKEIRGISQAYVTHSVGSRLPSPVTSTQGAEAYALYYSTINAAKILHLLPLLTLPRTLSVLDIGCGPGTAGLALLTALQHPFELTCVESAPAMRTVAERLLSQWRTPHPLEKLTMLGTLNASSRSEYDLIIAANVLAEMPHNDATLLIEILASRLRPEGYLLLLEPGQQAHTRRLMALRDQIVHEHHDLAPLFPCLRADTCPMLRTSDTDWCHDTLEWQQPRLNRQFDHLLAFNKHRIKYAGFVFQRGGVLLDGVRVITPPEKTRAGIEAILCGKDMYGIARIRKGARSDGTRPLEKASVFERLRMSTPRIGDLPPDVVFTRVR